MRTENLDRYQAMFELAGSQINAAVRWTREKRHRGTLLRFPVPQ